MIPSWFAGKSPEHARHKRISSSDGAEISQYLSQAVKGSGEQTL